MLYSISRVSTFWPTFDFEETFHKMLTPSLFVKSLSKFTILGYEINLDESMDNAIVIFINLLLGLMAAHLIKKGFEIFTDWPIESFEAESEGPFPFSFLPPVKIGKHRYTYV